MGGIRRVNPPDKKRSLGKKDDPLSRAERAGQTESSNLYALALKHKLCMFARFPEAARTMPKDGYYANMYANVLQDLLKAEGKPTPAAASSATGHFVQKTAKDGKLLRKVTLLMLPSNQLTKIEQNIQQAHNFNKYTDSWVTCMKTKPNLDFFSDSWVSPMTTSRLT